MMAFSWDEYVELARYLGELKNGSGFSFEAACRTGMSRTYYAVYRYAHDYAEDKLGFVPTNENVHKKLIDHFKDSTGHEYISQHLVTLRRFRNCCDKKDLKGSCLDEN